MFRINEVLVRRYSTKFAESNMTARVWIYRPAPALLNDTTGQLSAQADELVYEGKARVSTAGGPVSYQLGDEMQYFSQTTVSIPLVVDGEPTLPQVNDQVIVTAHHDALMVNRQFRVTDVEAAGQYEPSRRMTVVGIQRSETFTPDENIPAEWYV